MTTYSTVIDEDTSSLAADFLSADDGIIMRSYPPYGGTDMILMDRDEIEQLHAHFGTWLDAQPKMIVWTEDNLGGGIRYRFDHLDTPRRLIRDTSGTLFTAADDLSNMWQIPSETNWLSSLNGNVEDCTVLIEIDGVWVKSSEVPA